MIRRERELKALCDLAEKITRESRIKNMDELLQAYKVPQEEVELVKKQMEKLKFRAEQYIDLKPNLRFRNSLIQ